MGPYHDVCVCYKRVTVSVQCTYVVQWMMEMKIREWCCVHEIVLTCFTAQAGKDEEFNRRIRK
jgi:hypothetical protein